MNDKENLESPFPGDSQVPTDVTAALGSKNWSLALELAIQAGWRDENQLTDLIFFARHPELPPKKLDPRGPNFKQLSGEWSRILEHEVRKAIQEGDSKAAHVETDADSADIVFGTASGGGKADNYKGGSSEFQAASVLAAFVSSKTQECLEDAQLKDPMKLPDDCLKRLEGTQVAIVGGGLAGLMAARRLREHRVNVTVLEARGQVGGRVLSNTTFGSGRITEIGAELIGSFHTIWLALARHYGIAVISRMDQGLYLRAGLSTRLTLDKPLRMDEILQLDEEMARRVLKPIAELAVQIVDPCRPWEQEIALKDFDISVAKALNTYCNVDKHKDARLWKMIEHLIVNDEVASLDDMNFLGLLCKVRAGQGARFGMKEPNLIGYWEELEIFRCADGCQAMATKLAEEIQTAENTTKKPKAVLQLSRAVTNIDLSKQGVTLRVKVVQPNLSLAAGPPVSMTTRYDYVIFAIPPSVWDGVAITVDGKDARLKDEIGVMGMGPAIKFFSNVKERFWIKEKAAPYGGSSTLGQVWEGTDNQTRVGNQAIVLSVFAGPAVDGRRVPTMAECEAELTRLYTGYAANLTDRHYSDWPNEPFIKTGYASPGQGQIFTVGKKLSQPFHDRMFFAGEHTQMDSFGYMEGALRSGQRAADNVILKSCGLRKDSSPARIDIAEI